jgi:hypothetical protein
VLGELAAIGALAGGGLLTLVAIYGSGQPGFIFPTFGPGSYVLGTVLGIGSSFAVAAAYYGASNAFGARGSSWATFAGFWIGLVPGGLLIPFSLIGSPPNGNFAFVGGILLSVGAFVGMPIAYELSASPVAATGSSSSARRGSVARPWFAIPSFAVGANSVSLQVAGSF